MPLRRHCDATAMSLRCHCGDTAVPLRRHCGDTDVPLHRHCGATAVPLRCHCGARRYHREATAVPLRFHCGSTAKPLRRHYEATAVTLRCHCGATAVPLWCHWRATKKIRSVIFCHCGLPTLAGWLPLGGWLRSWTALVHTQHYFDCHTWILNIKGGFFSIFVFYCYFEILPMGFNGFSTRHFGCYIFGGLKPAATLKPPYYHTVRRRRKTRARPAARPRPVQTQRTENPLKRPTATAPPR